MTDGGGPDAPDSTETWPTDAPLSDLAEGVAERRRRADGTDPSDPFAEPPFEEVGADDIWEPSGPVTAPRSGDDRTTVVPTRSFCEACRHFSAPPAARCSHEGTDILEFVDRDHARVRDCPVVAERDLDEDGPLG